VGGPAADYSHYMRTKRRGIEAIRALGHPVAYRVLAAIGMYGPQTTSSLGDQLADVPASSLYRHLARLREVGVLRVASERQTRGAVERTYALASTGSAAFGASDVAAVPVPELRKALRNFIATMAADLVAFVESRAFARNRLRVSAALRICTLTDEEYLKTARALNAVIVRAKARSPGGPGAKRRYFYVVTLPDMVRP
jgi:DNA-binding transcriptional ArsR family regulator